MSKISYHKVVANFLSVRIRGKTRSPYLLFKIITSIYILFFFPPLNCNLNAQCTGTLLSIFPGTFDGLMVTQTYTGDVSSGATFTNCGVTAGPTYLGGAVLSGSPFTQTLTFTGPINNVIYVINASDSIPTNTETFTFTVDAGVLNATQTGTCLYTQIGNVFRANGSGASANAAYITLISSTPYTSLTVSGTGGNNGSYMALCSSLANFIGVNNNFGEINIFPNPNDGNMTIEYQINNNAILEIRDINEKLMSKYYLPVNYNKKQIENDALENGIYFYRIISDNKIFKTGKIIVMK
ncbi:MAG TPA: T9SS type A sorting domain-containing protein [Bacteroidia bacterium]|jgi:hypothetical protein|nr:T9SS type A sorting domain-containing protein [Bacteroidia bacterium]